jgi:hypothetical protein
MVLKNIAHVVFGYPSNRNDKGEKKASVKEKIEGEQIYKREAVAPSPRPIASSTPKVPPAPVATPDTATTPAPVLETEEDKEKAAEALLTIIEDGEEKGTVAENNESPQVVLEKPTSDKDRKAGVELEAESEATVEVKAEQESVSEVEQEAANKDDDGKEDKGEGDLMADLFRQEVEKKESYIDLLISTLQDMSAQELLNEAREVKTMMYEWQKKREVEAMDDSQQVTETGTRPARGVTK